MEITWGQCPHVPKENGGLPGSALKVPVVGGLGGCSDILLDTSADGIGEKAAYEDFAAAHQTSTFLRDVGTLSPGDFHIGR